MAVEKNKSKKSTSKSVQVTEPKTKKATNGSDKETPKARAQENHPQSEAFVEPKKPTAKAGKRSAKSLKEVEQKLAKETRKIATSHDNDSDKSKANQKPPRSRLERRGKKYQEAASLIDKSKSYSINDAVELAIKTSPVKFDASVELHLNLNVDPKQADQNIRGTVVLPSGSGKSTRIAVYGEAEEVTAAKKAGADIAASDEFLQQLDKEKIDFDVLIVPPKVMPKLGKYAKLLGPKGLMPNPKSGTVAVDIAKAVKEAKSGKVEFRVDSNGIIHTAIGKVSFGSQKLSANAEALIDNVKASRPSSIKGDFISSSYLSTSMGPSIRLTV